MGLSVSTPLPRPPVQAGKTRLCVGGFGLSHHTGRARSIVDTIVKIYPETYESWFYFDTRGFRPKFLTEIKAELSEEQQKQFAAHKTSPFCWIEKANEKPFALGGRDKLCEWVIANFPNKEKDEPILSLCREEPSRTMKEVFFDNKTPGTARTEL